MQNKPDEDIYHVSDRYRCKDSYQEFKDHCKGVNCTSTYGSTHSKECYFEHFLAYTGYWRQPFDVIDILRQAYYDGIEKEKE